MQRVSAKVGDITTCDICAKTSQETRNVFSCRILFPTRFGYALQGLRTVLCNTSSFRGLSSTCYLRMRDMTESTYMLAWSVSLLIVCTHEVILWCVQWCDTNGTAYVRLSCRAREASWSCVPATITCSQMLSFLRMALFRCLEEVAWGAYKSLQHAGQTHKVPVGTACESCFAIGIEKLRFKTWRSFVEEHAHDEDVQEKVVECRKALTDGAPREVCTTSASKRVQYECEVSRDFRAYDACALKKRLKLQRLTNRATSGVPQLLAPSLLKPGEEETLFVFQSEEATLPSDDGYNVRVKAKFTFETQELLLKDDAALFRGHAANEMQYAANNDAATPAMLMALRRAPNLNEFVDNFFGSLTPPPTSGSASSHQAASGVTGKAAEAFEVQDVDAEVHDVPLDTDLTYLTVGSKKDMPSPMRVEIHKENQYYASVARGESIDVASDKDSDEYEDYTGLTYLISRLSNAHTSFPPVLWNCLAQYSMCALDRGVFVRSLILRLRVVRPAAHVSVSRFDFRLLCMSRGLARILSPQTIAAGNARRRQQRAHH